MDAIVEKTPISIRVPVDVLGDLDRVAAALDRDRSWVMLRAFRQYLDNEGAEVLQDAAGLASLDRGEGVDFDDVQAEAEAIVARARADRVGKAG